MMRMKRSTSLLWASLALAACGGAEPAAESAPSATKPVQSAEDRAIKRRLRQAEDARRTETRARAETEGMADDTRRARSMTREERDKQIRDRMHTPVDSFRGQRVP